MSGHKSLESVPNYARKLSSARKRNISTIFSNHVDNKKINLEEQKQPQTNATVPSTSTSDPMPNDSVQNLLNIFDKRESVQNGGFFPFFSNCNVTFNITK